MAYRVLADLVVLVHVGFVAFALLGALLTLRWPRAIYVHLGAVTWAVVVELTGWICPLTPIEQALRQRGGEAGYSGGFIEHYVLPLLYPAALTPTVQLWLAMIVVVVNVVLYGWVWHRRRRRRD